MSVDARVKLEVIFILIHGRVYRKSDVFHNALPHLRLSGDNPNLQVIGDLDDAGGRSTDFVGGGVYFHFDAEIHQDIAVFILDDNPIARLPIGPESHG